MTRPAVVDAMPRVFGASDFVARAFTRDPALFFEMAHEGLLEGPHDNEALFARVGAATRNAGDERELGRVLRRLRLRESLRAAWRDIAGWAELAETLAHMSCLAEACLSAGLDRLDGWLAAKHGRPRDSGGRVQGLVVVGMGKLGARELNFSSDVDLVFAYREDGATGDGTSLNEYFTKLARSLVNLIGKSTADGVVFRVDARLRPFGESGPMVLSFDAMEDYYQAQGREWERYAWVKARCVAGDRAAWPALWDSLRPFVYRRYLDYGVFDSLREMKAMIAAEVRRKKLAGDVKLGSGGIREVEFIGQVLQLIRGGVIPELQCRPILTALDRLAGHGLLDVGAARELTRAYVFLRRVENRLQEWGDLQTHALPVEPVRREAMAMSLDFPDWEEFLEALDFHREKVHRHFNELLEQPGKPETADASTPFHDAWAAASDAEQAAGHLARAGIADSAGAGSHLSRLRQSPKVRSLSQKGRSRLDRLVPMVAAEAAKTGQPAVVLGRMADIVEAVCQRTNYLALLQEEPQVLALLAGLCDATPLVSRQVASHPVLMDELVDPRMLYSPPDRDGLRRELASRMGRCPDGDLEVQMEDLRIFKQVNTLRVIAADVSGALPLMKVSDRLTWIAEAVLEQVLDLAWKHVSARFGKPACTLNDTSCDKGFAVIGYGKLGGLELGYGSDLDLVFMHAGKTMDMTDGERQLDAGSFFARLGQRFIHILTAHTSSGALYEIDMRLRPSGGSGVLVSNLSSWREYELEDAWTWEHQALVRARFVAGDPVVGEAFAMARDMILRQPRDRDRLREDVVSMRDRMRENLLKRKEGMFDLKQGVGGIVDIEFINQYFVLALSYEYPELAIWTDNVRILETIVKTNLLPAGEARGLRAAYLALRADTHRLALERREALVPDDRHLEHRRLVIRLWNRVLGEETGEHAGSDGEGDGGEG
ncbi:MAG: bifunctional [glutamate--ammonia ligase]-adenylyl-L-tyrosine phosphorylase/[glutamate--ammonia-ligase] adenylyltransferase [Desulfatibacillaceae bacterium]